MSTCAFNSNALLKALRQWMQVMNEKIMSRISCGNVILNENEK